MRKLSKREWVAAVLAICFVAYMFFGGEVMAFISSFNKGLSGGEEVNLSSMENNGPSVKSEDVVVGQGLILEAGMQVGVHYLLKLQDGTVIQDSREVGGGAPFRFVSGAGQLIPGWEMGILGMRVGGKRMLMIPPELGYGSQAVGPIPANSTLIFEIEVVEAGFLPQSE